MTTSAKVRVYFPQDPDELHYVYQVADKHPPEGVKFVYDRGDESSVLKRTIESVTSSINRLGSIPVSLYNRYWRGAGVTELARATPEYDIYHNRSAARRRKEPWVQECEHVGNAIGRNWREKLDNDREVERVGDAFAATECKAIMPHTEAAAESIRRTIPNSQRFEEKLEPVPIAYDPPETTSPPDGGTTQFLFVGSSYFDDQFYIKGGDKVLRAYERIRKDIDAQLVVRSDMALEYVERYEGYDDIDLLTDVIPREELETLYEESDVFVFPSAQGTPGAVFREAMGHALAVVGLDIWGNAELVEDGETGFLVEPDESFQYVYPEYNVPVVGTGNYFRRRGSRSMEDIVADLTNDDEALVARLAEKMRVLAEDADLRQRMALAGHERITEGDLSLSARTEQLGRIYREAVAG